MKRSDITIEQLNGAISTIEDFQSSKFQRDFQKLSSVLPLALDILKAKRLDMEQKGKGSKFYAPMWVRTLLDRLSNDERPLSETEYKMFSTEVRNLSISDYKPAVTDMNGYEEQYTTFQEINDTVCALKHYFLVETSNTVR